MSKQKNTLTDIHVSSDDCGDKSLLIRFGGLGFSLNLSRSCDIFEAADKFIAFGHYIKNSVIIQEKGSSDEN